METLITLTLQELKSLLDQQKTITVEKCLSNSAYYNEESTESQAKSLPINPFKFKENGHACKYPSDFQVLTKYLK